MTITPKLWKKVLGLAICAVGLFYRAGFKSDINLLLTLAPIAIAILLLAIVFFTASLVSKFARQNVGKSDRIYKIRQTIAIVISFIFLLLGGWAINHYCLPYLPHLIAILGNLGIICFAIFLQWTLIAAKRKSVLFTGTVVFVLLISLLTASKSITYKHFGAPSIETLQSLPYLSSIPVDENDENTEKVGVTKHDRKLAYNGINIFCMGTKAFLVDMFGNTLHTWTWPINSPIESYAVKMRKSGNLLYTWTYLPIKSYAVKMCKNGDLLVGFYEKDFVRLDWNSRIKWKKQMYFHHDIAIAENEDIYVLDRKDEVFFLFGLPLPIHNDYAVIMSPFLHKPSISLSIIVMVLL